MRHLGIHIVLYKPEIPANTGNIARTCAANKAILHLIHPLGFSIGERAVKRAGLDYWSSVTIIEHESIEAFFESEAGGVFYFIEDYGDNKYSDGDFSHLDKDYYFIFGRETSGIPLELIMDRKNQCLAIPMASNVRSLNLSNAVAIVVYEVLRQQEFYQLN